MPGGRTPGPLGTDAYRPYRIDSGTAVRSRSPAPVSVGNGSRVPFMPLKDRFIEVLRRTLPRLPEGMRAEFAQLLTPRSLEIMAGVMATWGLGHFFGYGEAADVVVVGLGFVFMGAQVFSAGADLGRAIRETVNATCDADLDRAAVYMARFVAVAGVTGLTALFFKGAKRAAPKIRGALAGALADSRFGGIAASHLRAFQEVARDTNRIIAVRFTNPNSTPWIEKGFPPKPLEISKVGLKTDKATGFVRALTEAQVKGAKGLGYYVVDDAGIARDARGAIAKLPAQPEWPVRPGQVVDPKQLKPLVGDYDLLGVIDPQAPGRNLALAASDGGSGAGAKVLDDWSNPMTRRVARAINARLDQPRIMHGAHDARFTLPAKAEEGAMIFFPDGKYQRFNSAAEVENFYKSIGRKPVGAPEKIGE